MEKKYACTSLSDLHRNKHHCTSVANNNYRGCDRFGIRTLSLPNRGVDNFLGLGGGGANKVKTKELQFGSRGRVWPPPARSAEAIYFNMYTRIG